MGLVTQQDPIGIAGGLNLYGYAGGDPINFSDPCGLCAEQEGGDTLQVVEVCEAVADLPGNVIGLKHEWLRILGVVEAGLGQAGGGVPGEGDYATADNSPYVTMTEITDHAGRGDQPGARCYAVRANPSCVIDQLAIGQSRGRWSAFNQCQTFVSGVLSACAPIPPIQADATRVSAPYRPPGS